MSLAVPAAISMLAAIALTLLARWLYQPGDRKAPDSSRSSNAWAVAFALLAGILLVLSIFLWFRYIVIDYLKHLGASFD
jgi:predicted MFS family arabinose efflux permease